MSIKNKTRLATAESVAKGHPDKLADQISDAILDAYLSRDPEAHVACESALSGNEVWVFGEVSTPNAIHEDDLQAIVRGVLRRAGYTSEESGINPETCHVRFSLRQQSPDIAFAVDRINRLGAGDQGIIYGYATSEHASYLPAPLAYAHALVKMLEQTRLEGVIPLLPDGKAQVTMAYNGDARAVTAIVVSAQHDASLKSDDLWYLLRDKIDLLFSHDSVDTTLALRYINPSGRFVVGGPAGDAGLTGRKIAVDTYGGLALHGGGAFSGKDPTKVDRSAAYAARHAAKHVVVSGLARRCEVSLAYAIGAPRPVAIDVDTFGTGVLPDAHLGEIVNTVFGFEPSQIIERLNLRQPIYLPTATYGHFSDPTYPWEQLDRLNDVIAEAKRYGW